jgi:tripartite-type tricarboxylate transporter receptor subunit TctC
MRILSNLACVACFTCFAQLAGAQWAPVKPVRFIVPAAAGGIHDTVARTISPKLSESWGQQLVIDNRTGAGGIIATDLGAKAAADGYTWLMNISAFTTNPHLYKKLPYDTERDFEPVTLLVSFPLVLAVHPSLPAKSVKEFIALAKARPGQINYASPGVGTSPHLAMELFRTMAGIELTHVPYKGGPLGTRAILAGEVSVYFNSITTPLPHIQAGRLRALGVSGTRSSPALPAVPPISQAGLPGFEVIGWLGLLVPDGTPQEIVSGINAEVKRALGLSDVRQRLAREGVEPVGNSPREFAAFLESELKKWGRVVKEAGLESR